MALDDISWCMFNRKTTMTSWRFPFSFSTENNTQRNLCQAELINRTNFEMQSQMWCYMIHEGVSGAAAWTSP